MFKCKFILKFTGDDLKSSITRREEKRKEGNKRMRRREERVIVGKW